MRTCDISLSCGKAAKWRRNRERDTTMANTEAACTRHKIAAKEDPSRPWTELVEKPLEDSSEV